MHAFIRQVGPADQIEVGELDSPIIGTEQVRIRVHAASINPIDTYVRSGVVAMDLPMPFIPGCDGAGVIEEVGANVKRFQMAIAYGRPIKACSDGKVHSPNKSLSTKNGLLLCRKMSRLKTWRQVKECSVRGFVMFKATPIEMKTAAEDLSRWMADGKVISNIGARFTLDEVAKAHELQESATLQNSDELSGKIVVTLED